MFPVLSLIFVFKGMIIIDDKLEGKVFYGKAVEITSPDVDRMPRLRDEVITFSEGKVSCEMFKDFSVNESVYTSEVDGRRAIAVEVIVFNSSIKAVKDGKEVNIEFNGEVYGGNKLSGTMIITYPDNLKEEYSIVAETN